MGPNIGLQDSLEVGYQVWAFQFWYFRYYGYFRYFCQHLQFIQLWYYKLYIVYTEKNMISFIHFISSSEGISYKKL